MNIVIQQLVVIMEPRFNDNLAFLLTDGKAGRGVLIVDEDRAVEGKLMIEIGGY
jgi:hypothetical protein